MVFLFLLKIKNMKTLRIAALTIICFVFLFSCKSTSEKSSETLVLIETDLGNIKLKLYDETPIHRDNFIKLVEEGFYDGIIFHRVINNFMIQGGDPSTKENKELDHGDVSYTLEAEFVSSLFHKKGALAAARLGDAQNPHKKSSGSQFYIVQGRTFSPEELDKQLSRKQEMIRVSTVNKFIMEKADKMMDMGIDVDFTKLYADLQDTIAIVLNSIEPYKFSEKQVEAYSTIGGTPHLDGDYTVFGEVIEGLEVVDKIASVETGQGDKPLKDIRMKVRLINK
jgi:peptidylprolyl isomerase